MNILLVEDSPHDALFATKVLESYDMVVTHTSTFGGGLEALQQQTFDVAVFDLGLPDSDGVASLAGLCRNIPIVVLTSNDNLNTALKAIKFGVQDYVIKDNYTDDTLRRSVQYARERFLRAQLELENERLRQQVMSKIASLSKNLSKLQKKIRNH